MNTEQQAQLQAEVQRELERREWAEPGDNVMAEYITVLLANGSSRDRVQTEMDDLVGSDFDSRFLDWLFDTARDLTASRPEPAPVAASSSRSPSVPTQRAPSGGGSRLLSNALGTISQPEKRKFGDDQREDAQNKRRIPDGPRGMGAEGRSLQDRMGPNRGRGGMQVRGMAGPGGRGGMQNGPMGNMGRGFQQNFGGPGMMQPGGFGGGFYQPGQQEMMAQMMMMQANMAQMGEMMQQMAQEKEMAQAQSTVTTSKPISAKIPHGTKLGKHTVSVVPPKRSSSPGPIPDKPTSKSLCRYSVGCANSRCPYSHPSPVADEKTGMVLSDEACTEGKACKDPECIKSHVSPAAVHGEAAGPSRMLCKYLNCTNPSCQFRHEDAAGNPIPPPALTAIKNSKSKPVPIVHPADAGVSDNEDGDMEVVMSSKSLMDGALDDKKTERPCRFGERCTRADCRFTHPVSRPTPKGAKPASGKPGTNGIGGGMNISKKFGAAAVTETKLDPTVGEFKPATPA